MMKKCKYLFSICMIILIGLASFSYIFYINLNAMQNSYNEAHKILKDNEWNYIVDIISENSDKAKIQSDIVTNQIKLDLIKSYNGAGSDLMQDMLTVKINKDSKFLKILNNNIKGKLINDPNDPDNNDMFVMGKWSTLTSTNLKYKNFPSAAILSDKSINCAKHGGIRTIDLEISMHYNKTLAFNTIKSILNQDSGILYWEFLPSYNKNHIKVTNCSIDNLKLVFDKEGIKGLYNYEILNPSYLNPDSDIFGNPDIDLIGNLNNNYKLIINQGFLLKDLFKKYNITLMKYDNNIKYTYSKYIDMKLIYEVESILFILLLLALLICMTYVSNNVVESSEDNDNGCDNNK